MDSAVETIPSAQLWKYNAWCCFNQIIHTEAQQSVNIANILFV